MKEVKLKRVMFVALLTLVLAVVSASAEEPLKITLWHMEARPTRVQRIQEVVNEFNRTHPQIKIGVEVQSWGEVYIKTVGAIQAGKEPDFLFTIPDFTTSVKMTGVIQPVDEVVQTLKGKYTIFDATLAPYYYEDHYWAVPLYGMCQVLWFRKDLFKQAGLDPARPPRTWSEMLKAAKDLVGSGVVPHATAVAGDWHMATDQIIYTLMVTNKAEHIFDEKGEVIFDNPRTVEAYDFYKKLFDLSPPGAASWRWEEPIVAFVAGKIAMVIEKGQYNEQWELRTKLPADYLGAAFVPVPDKDGQLGTIYYSNGIMLLSRDPRKREAFREFVTYLYDPEVMGRLLNAAPAFFLPVTAEASKAMSYWSDPVVQKHREKVELMIEQSKSGKLFGFTQKKVNLNIGRIATQNILAWTAQRMNIDGLPAKEAVALGAKKMREAIR